MDKLASLWARFPTLGFLLPMAAFMLVGSLEPKPGDEASWLSQLGVSSQHYPLVYSTKIVLTVIALLLVTPLLRQLPWRLSWLGLLVGLVGGGVWIGICSLKLETPVLAAIGLQSFVTAGVRSGYDPLTELAGQPLASYGFLAMRFFGLVIVIAIAEEFFLRGWVARYFAQADWQQIPFGQLNLHSAALCIIVPALMHPAEVFAAVAWFGLVTWLMWRTRSFGDCVLAHAITNLILGIYVVASGRWEWM